MDSAEPDAKPRRQPAHREVNREVCRTALETMGALRDPWLADAFDAVDREAFVPPAAWLPILDGDGLWQFIDRGTDEAVWRRAVWNPHRSVVTQLNDGQVLPHGPAAGDFTSSVVSALDVVLRKLHHLDCAAVPDQSVRGARRGVRPGLCDRSPGR